MDKLEKLVKIAKEHNVYRIACCVLDDPKFKMWSGSHKKGQHHYEKGGLLRHTLEVVELSLMFNKYYGEPVCNRKLVLAGIFHDSGKMYDYMPVDSNYNKWIKTDHARKIRHLPKSIVLWTRAVQEVSETIDFNKTYGFLSDGVEDEITHAILSHHGIEGSPVAPDTKLAWFLHLADCMSARIDDVDTFDYINKQEKINL